MQHQQLKEEVAPNVQSEQSIVAANKALLAAIKENSLEKVKLAITPEINLNAYVLGMTFFQYAILTKASTNIMEFLIEKGAEINKRDERKLFTPFHYAVMTGNTEAMHFLNSKKINIHEKSKDRSVLHLACEPGSYKNKSIDMYKENDLETQSFHINSEVISLLIQLGIDVNSKDVDGATPLHYLTSNDYLDHIPHITAIVKLLITAGANIANCNNNGYTALHYAASSKSNVVHNNNMTAANYEIVKLLLESGAQINAKDKKTETPLHLACIRCNNIEVIRLLIKNKANINATAKDGTTPLMYAVFIPDNLEVVRLLVDNKATIDVKDSTGHTLLQLAVTIRKNDKVVAYLLEKGAKVNARLNKNITPLYLVTEVTVAEKEKILTTHFKNKTITEILNTENLEPFKETFKQIDQDYFATATTLIAHGADLNLLFKSELYCGLNQTLTNKLIEEYLKKINQEKNTENKIIVIENIKKPEEAEKEKEIARKKEQKKLEQQELLKKQAEEAALSAAKPIHETIAKMFANTTIEFTYDETKKSYTFKFKTNDSYQAFKIIFKNHQQLKNTKLQFSGLSISFTEDEGKLKKAFKEDNNFISRLKDIIEKNIAQKEESPKTITQAEGEAEWDSAFKVHWQTYLKSIFPFDITVEANKDDLVLTVTLNQFNEKTKALSTILNKFFDVNTGTGEATVILKDNKIIIKPLNKSSYNSYKDIAQPTFEKTSDLKALIYKELNSNNHPTPSTTSQILGKTNTPPTQKNASKKTISDNNNANTEPPKEEDKEAFKVKIKAFMNYISGNILTDKLNYFKITRINQNLSRIEMQFDVKAYSSFATNTTPTGSMEFLTKMKQAVNKVLGQDVMTFDEKENSIKFFFSKVDKAELFKKQDEIRKVFNELNTEVENEIKISDGKQEIKTDNNNADAATNNDVFTVNNLFNEIHQILARVKKNPTKSKNLLTLLKVLNTYSPTKNASDDVIFFQAYKLLATYTLNALSQEHYAENHLPHMYNLRSITRHAYDVYEWQDFHQLFSPFFKQLEEICIQIFNSTTDATPILFKQKNSLLPHVTSLNDELNLFAPLLTEGLLKGNLPIADINSFEAQIASLKADLNNNGLSERTIKIIQFAILQLCCQIGESADKSKKLEKEIYGELHKPNLKNDPFEILNKLFQRYLFPANEKTVNTNVNMKI